MKQSKYILFALLAGLTPLASVAQNDAPDGFKLVWSDEFDGTELDTKAWTIEVTGGGGGNQELQYYTNRKENVKVENGNLVLTARRENYNGKSFTSGRINSSQKIAFKHGLIQARIKMPSTANGLWPAYWMMGNDIIKYGWPRCGEIDIVEMGHANGIKNGTQDRYFAGTLHYGPGASNEQHQQTSTDITAPADNAVENGEYHTFTVYWDSDCLEMYYDLDLKDFDNFAVANQAMYFTRDVAEDTNPYAMGTYFQKPFYFLFNLAVGGTYTDIYDPAGITALPNPGDEASMYVDYIRVYQYDDDEETTGDQYLYLDENGEKVTNIPADDEPNAGEDNKTEIGSFATKALDENGETTFDFDEVEEAVLISTSGGVTQALTGRGVVVADYNVNNTTTFLDVWQGEYSGNPTYVNVPRDGLTNSFGYPEGFNRFTVTSEGWSGLAFRGAGVDLSLIDDTYWFHFAMRGVDLEQHTAQSLTLGGAKFIVGDSDGKLASIGDYKRDGEWYYFDIPVKALQQFATPLFGETPANYSGNILAFSSGAVTDAELNFDNIFFYKKAGDEPIPTYTDTKANLGKYGSKALDENDEPTFDIDNADNIIPLVLDQTTWETWTGAGNCGDDNYVNTKEHDCTEQGGKEKFFLWQGFSSSLVNVKNSFGMETYADGLPGITHWSADLDPHWSWNGMGYASIDVDPKDLSEIDESYYLHFALRSDAAVAHVPITIGIGEVSLTFGDYSINPIFADFNRDGEWYNFDIPVSELIKYAGPDGKPLFNTGGQNGTIDAFNDYVFTISTGNTFYNGAPFAWNNVFFYKKFVDDSEPANPLGDYTTKSLDDNGESYFDFEGKEFISFNAGAAEREEMGEENIKATYYNFNNWEGAPNVTTYNDGTQSGTVPNSFGNSEGWIDLTVANSGWSGGGFINADGADLSILDEGEWYLHFAMRGNTAASHQIGFGEAKFTIGPKAFAKNVPAIGNYETDGEWYSYDIPYSVLKSLATGPIFPASNANGSQSKWTGNLFWFMSGGTTGTEIQLDNVFLWRPIPTAIKQPAVSQSQTGTVTYYDLSGRRVQRLDKAGLYIVKTGNTVKKVLVK